MAEDGLLNYLNNNQRDIIDKIVKYKLDDEMDGWYFSDVDPYGACFTRRGRVVRVNFDNPILSEDEFKDWGKHYGADF